MIYLLDHFNDNTLEANMRITKANIEIALAIAVSHGLFLAELIGRICG